MFFVECVSSRTSHAYSSQVNFTSSIKIYIHKKTQFPITETNIEVKSTATTVLRNELKYFLISEGNTCIAEPNLEVLPLIWFSRRLVEFLLLKV